MSPKLKKGTNQRNFCLNQKNLRIVDLTMAIIQILMQMEILLVKFKRKKKRKNMIHLKMNRKMKINSILIKKKKLNPQDITP